MERAMSDRAGYVLVGLLFGAIVAVHAAIKPGINPEDVEHMSESFAKPSVWHGRVAQDFDVELRNGSRFRLADHVGREVVVINFFATWCGPCRAEMPELQRYAERLAADGKPFVLIGMDVQETPEQVDRFVRGLGLTFPVAIDGSGDIVSRYGVTAFPTTIVVGADGRIKLYQAGAIDNANVAFDAVVEPEFAAIAAGRGTSRDAYLAELDEQAPPAADGREDALQGRALSIAQAMPCPCGCDDRVIACSCQTAKGIKARLREGVDAGRTDREVMEKLNEEFCMKGM
jgi:thiol-disulfide isomerase/thioredoxin